MATIIPDILNLVEEGDGFGIGGFGGVDEPFGSLGTEELSAQDSTVGFAVIPSPPKGAVILGLEDSVAESISGVIEIGRTANIDSSGVVCRSTRNLIFEN